MTTHRRPGKALRLRCHPPSRGGSARPVPGPTRDRRASRGKAGASGTMNPGCTELHRVAPNVPRPVLNRRGLGEQPDGALGRGVRGRTPVAWANCNYAGNGRGVDDRPSAGRPHGRNGRARTQENALAVYLQDPVPYLRLNGVNLGGSRSPPLSIPVIPALLTRMSSLPYSNTARDTAPSYWSGSVVFAISAGSCSRISSTSRRASSPNFQSEPGTIGKSTSPVPTTMFFE